MKISTLIPLALNAGAITVAAAAAAMMERPIREVDRATLEHIRNPHVVRPYTPRLYAKDLSQAAMGQKDSTSSDNEPKRFEKTAPLAEICKQSTHAVENAAQLSQLQAQCTEVTGSIVISEYIDPVVDLGKLQSIKGDLLVRDSPSVIHIQAPRLTNVGGTFELNSLTSLNSVHTPVLRDFNTINWRVVPILTDVELDPNAKTAKRVIISDTSLVGFEGFSNVEELEVLNINNNRFMEYIKTNVKRVTQQLSISANAKELELDMPSLEWADNITVRDTSSASMPKLKNVKHSLEFIENMFHSLELPALESVGGTLGVIENVNLKKVDFTNVTYINGGLMIANNTQIEKIDFFPELQQIGGAIQFTGKFKDTSFPKLKLVKGSALIISNSDSLDCAKWTTPTSGSSIIRGGKITCTSGKKQNSVSVNEDGTVIGRDVSDLTGGFHAKESSASSGMVDTTKLSKVGWSLAFAWATGLFCLVVMQ